MAVIVRYEKMNRNISVQDQGQQQPLFNLVHLGLPYRSAGSDPIHKYCAIRYNQGLRLNQTAFVPVNLSL